MTLTILYGTRWVSADVVDRWISSSWSFDRIFEGFLDREVWESWKQKKMVKTCSSHPNYNEDSPIILYLSTLPSFVKFSVTQAVSRSQKKSKSNQQNKKLPNKIKYIMSFCHNLNFDRIVSLFLNFKRFFFSSLFSHFVLIFLKFIFGWSDLHNEFCCSSCM